MTDKNGKPQYADDNASQKYICNRYSLTEAETANRCLITEETEASVCTATLLR